MSFAEMELDSFSDSVDYYPKDNHLSANDVSDDDISQTPSSPMGQPDRGFIVVFSSTTPFRPPMIPVTTPHFRSNMKCDHINTDYHILPSVICTFCLLFGFVFCFFGYRYFKISMFGTGFLFGSLVTYLVCLEENFLPMEGKLGVAMGAGILCGLITMLVQYVGLFMTGFHLGFLLAVAGLVVAEMFVSVNSKWVPIGSVLGIGLLNALLCLKFQRAFSILATVVVGAVMMFIALDYAIDQLGFFHFALDRLKAVRSPLLCWFTWVSVTTIPLLSFLGCVLQAQVTGKNCDHRDIISLRRALKFSQQLSNNHTASTQHFAQPHQLHPKHHNYKHHHTSSHLPNHQELLSLHDKRHHKQLHRMHHKAHNKQQNKQQLQNNNKNSLSYQHLHRARRANGDILSKNFVCRIHEGLSSNRPVSMVG